MRIIKLKSFDVMEFKGFDMCVVKTKKMPLGKWLVRFRWREPEAVYSWLDLFRTATKKVGVCEAKKWARNLGNREPSKLWQNRLASYGFR